jgi:hypothetical protein
MSTTQEKTDSGTPGGAGGTAATKTDSTASAKAAAKKKHQQQSQKNQKANHPVVKKKQPAQSQAAKSNFEGIASGVNPMKGIVIAQGDGNLAGQFRVFQKKLAGAAADDKAYGLDSAILDLVAKVKSDFVKPKPSPLIHSNLVDVMERDEDGALTNTPTGEKKLVCFDPILKEEMEAEYSMDLKIQKSNWNQFERHYEGYYRTAIGNMDDTIIKYCRANKGMAAVEVNKDLVGLLLIVRSVCAQNNGAVKVDEDFQNLCTLHSALGYKQKKNVSDVKFADQIADRYGSAVFTSGKFTFGLNIYEKVLSTYPTSSSSPLTFIQYLQLPIEEQTPIDDLVKERTVAKLIVKNSLNIKLREHLVTAYSTGDSNCYPITISDALSLLSTFVRSGKEASEDDAVVSYHETNIELDTADEECDEYIQEETIVEDEEDDDVVRENNNNHVTFDATVMAAVIAEASTSIEDERFFGASFPQLQAVDDAYVSDEPNNVCCAHIVETIDDCGITPNIPTINYPDHMKDFELIMYHTAQRIKNQSDVYVINYNPHRPDLISHNYSPQTAESIIDYSDALRVKFKQAGMHDSTDLMTLFSDLSVSDISTELKLRFNKVNLKGIHQSTVSVLREETIRCLDHSNYNTIRYNQMMIEIGYDVEMDTFPNDNALLHHVVSATAIMQHRRRPNRWVNKITHKLIKGGITSIQILESKLEAGCVNDHLGRQHLPRLHHITLNGFQQILGATDFQQGRS